MIPEIIYTHTKDTAIHLSISDTSTRKVDPIYEQKIIADWNTHLDSCAERGENVWDGTSYRVNSIIKEQNAVYIELGPIKWSIRSPIRFIEELHKQGTDYRGNGAFVTALLQTSDKMFVFGKRPNGALTTIGGLISGEETPIHTFEDFDSMQNIELMEEIGIDASHITQRDFLGMLYSSAADVGFIFMLSTSLSASEVTNQFQKKQDDEISSLVFIPATELSTHMQEMGDYWSLIPKLVA